MKSRNHNPSLLLFSLVSLIFAFSLFHVKAEEKKVVVGYVEKVKVDSLEFDIKAKLDSGAATSSVNAEIIEIKESKENQKKKKRKKKGRKGDTIVFSIKNEKNVSKNFQKVVERWVKIKKKEGGFIRRPVVLMDICVAGQLISGEVNLADRETFNYDVLIGRNTLKKGNLIVDASKTFTAKANCPDAPQEVKKAKKAKKKKNKKKSKSS